MNMIQYITDMLNRDSTYSKVCLYVLIGFGAIILWKMLRGFIRGAYRQLVRTITFLLAAIVAFVAVKFLIGYLVDLIKVDTIAEAFIAIQDSTGIDLSAIYSIILDVDAEAIEGILILPVTVLLAPIVYILLFLVLRLIFGIIRVIIIRNSDIKASKGFLERLGGMCLAGVEAVLLISILILPITSVASFVDDTYTVIIGDDDDSTKAIKEQYVETIMPVTRHPVVDIAKRSVDSIISTSFNDTEVGLAAKDDVIYTAKIAIVDLPQFMGMNINELTRDNKRVIERTLHDIERSDLITSVAASVIKNAAVSFASETKSTMPAPFNTVFGDIISIFEDSDKETVAEDLSIIVDIIFFMSDNHIFNAMSDGDNLMNVLTAKNPETDTTIISSLIDLLNENERTKHLVTSMTKLSVSIFADSLGADSEQISQIYDNIKNDINGILAVDHSNLDAIKDALDNTFENNGIALSDEVVGSVANYIHQNIPATQLEDDDFDEVLLSIYDAYIEENGNGIIPDNFDGSGMPSFGDLFGNTGSSEGSDAENNSGSSLEDSISDLIPEFTEGDWGFLGQ